MRYEGIIIFRFDDMIFVRQFQAAWEVHQMFYTILLTKLHNFKTQQIEIGGRAKIILFSGLSRREKGT